MSLLGAVVLSAVVLVVVIAVARATPHDFSFEAPDGATQVWIDLEADGADSGSVALQVESDSGWETIALFETELGLRGIADLGPGSAVIRIDYSGTTPASARLSLSFADRQGVILESARESLTLTPSTEPSLPTQTGAPTQTSMPTPTVTPTETSVPTQTVSPTEPAVPTQTGAPTESGMPTDTSTPTPTGTPTEGLSPTPTGGSAPSSSAPSTGSGGASEGTSSGALAQTGADLSPWWFVIAAGLIGTGALAVARTHHPRKQVER